MEIPIVATGTANTASVRAWLARAGMASRVTASPIDVEGAAALVLPGVGAFGAAMDSLREHGLIEPLRARLRAGRPTLCICVGMQVLFERSAESPGVEGLGVLRGRVDRLPEGVRVPHMGWNVVDMGPGSAGASETAYFANSYGVLMTPTVEAALRGWDVGTTTHGVPFLASLSRGAVMACQFHPELSSGFGESVLRRWLSTPEAAPC